MHTEETHSEEQRALSEGLFNINAASRMSGLTSDVLRQWEARYRVVQPRRSTSGYRLYTPEDIERLRWLKAQVDRGVLIGQAAQMLAAGAMTAHPVENLRDADLPSVSLFAAALFRAFEAGDSDLTERVLARVEQHIGVERLCYDVIQPVLRDVGALWSTGHLSVATEHFASGMIRSWVIRQIDLTEVAGDAPLAIAACAPLEEHELGLLVLSLFLKRRGYRLHYLGQRTPVSALLDAVEQHPVDLVCISVSRADNARHLVDVLIQNGEEFQQVVLRRERPLVIAYGGLGFQRGVALRDTLAVGLGRYAPVVSVLDLGSDVYDAMLALDGRIVGATPL